MRIENAFEVPAWPDEAWLLLLDVPRVVPCMPGAALDEVIDERTWKTTMKVKLGPVAVAFLTDVVREHVDEEARRIRLRASGRDAKGRGQAHATIDSTVSAMGASGARVEIVTELQLSGPVGQFGGPVVRAVATQLTKRFAECLAEKLVAERATLSSRDRAGG